MTADENLEAKLADLRPPDPRAELRDEIRRAVDHGTGLGRPLPWLAAAAVLASLIVSIRVVEHAHESTVARFRDVSEVREIDLRWAANLRALQEEGLPRG